MPRAIRQTLAVLAIGAVLGAQSPTIASQATSRAEARSGSGAELLEDCRRYFAFLGRTGAGKEETFQQDPFGLGYCAGLVRGVARSVDDFHPDIECRLDSFSFAGAVRAVVLYLEADPSSLRDPDTVAVLHALQDAGMCARLRP